MTLLFRPIFIVLVGSLLLMPSANAQKQGVKIECFKSKQRGDPVEGNACRVEKDLFMVQTQNVIIECDSFVDFDDRLNQSIMDSSRIHQGSAGVIRHVQRAGYAAEVLTLAQGHIQQNA